MAKTAHRLVAPLSRIPDLPPKRDWQIDALKVATDILIEQQKPHMYMCAPTGTGKSRFIHELSETLDVAGDRIITVGLDQISNQLRKEFVDDYGYYAESNEWLISRTDRRVYVGTYQGLAAMAKKLNEANQEPSWETGVLFFDEIHVGGSNSGGRTGDENEFADQASIQRINTVFAPEKRVYVSATMQTADENILGAKRGHFYRYSLASAYKDGILNPVDMIEVHAGTTLKIEKIEKAFGKNIERLETLSSDDLEDLAKQVKDKSVTLVDAMSSLRWLVRARHREMIKLYANKHYGEQAIFYCPRIEDADWAAEYFNSFVNSGAFKNKPRAFAYHSDVTKSDEKLKRFENGGIEVLFVVGMLQEGFNMPSLALAFDCRFHRVWNPAKIARLIQKVGRLTRKDEGKGRSRYYYARDVSDYIATAPRTPNIDDENLDASDIESVIDEVDPDLEGAGLIAAQIIASTNGAFDFDADSAWEGSDVEVGLSTSEMVEVLDEVEDDHLEVTTISRRPIKLITTPLFVAIDAFGHAAKRSFDFCSIIGGNSADEKKKVLLALPVGKERPHWTTSLGKALGSYAVPSSKVYDAEFDAKIRARQPDWLPVKSDKGKGTSAEKKAALLALPVGEERPHWTTSLGRAVTSYTAPSTDCYDAEFDAKIRARQPDWLPVKSDKGKGTSAEKKAALLALPVGKYYKPRGRDTLVGPLYNYTRRGSSYDAEFDAKIRARQPDWLLDKSDKMTSAEKKAALLALPVGKKRPLREDTLGQALRSYISPNGNAYDAEFVAKIRARQPDWLPVKSDKMTSAEKKAALLALPVGKKPLAKDMLGKALYSYTTRRGGSYDAEFDAKIRARQPDWFPDKTDKMTSPEKKAALLALPVGKKRPLAKDTLGMVLYNYTRPSNGSYDAEFTTKIRARQPKWFKK